MAPFAGQKPLISSHLCVIYLFLAVLGLCCCVGFPLVAASRGCSLAVAQASRCSDISWCRAQAPRLSGFRSCITPAQQLQLVGSRAQVSSCGTQALLLCTCGTFPDQEFNPCLLRWHVGSFPLSHRRSPNLIVFILFTLGGRSKMILL